MIEPSPEALGFAAAAARLIGSKFRLHGRNPTTGLDCIGLVDASMKAIDRKPHLPVGYALRNVTIEHWLGCFELSGFELVTGRRLTGDLLLFRPGPGQHHIAIAEGPDSIIHAHAGLRRVVRQPWPALSSPMAHWRLRPSN